jgi:FkbM family methyltransferase
MQKQIKMSVRLIKRANSIMRVLTGCEVHKVDTTVERRTKWLKSLGIKTIFDIGANRGQFAMEAFQIYGNIKIVSFEPLQDCYAELLKIKSTYPSLTPYPFALGDTSEDSFIYRSSYAPSSSMLEMDDRHKALFPFSADLTKERIRIRRLDEGASEIDVEPALLIKLDVQGFEDRVIMGGRKTFARAKMIITEVNFERLYKGQADFNKVHSLLHDLGFRFRGFLHETHNKTTGCLDFADAYFLSDITIYE